jgi:CBS domain-containing protein
MNVSEIMTTDFEMIDATDSLREAARKMKSLNVGFLPVQEGTMLIGLVTDRDIVVRGLAEDRDVDATLVRDIVSSEVVYCYEDESVEDAVRLMADRQIRRLIVCDRNRLPVGVVSLGDIAAKTGQEQLSGEALERISTPAAPVR